MTHPMAEPWLDWQPVETFPQDGNSYLATDGRVCDGFPQVVYFENGRLCVPDSGICYAAAFFTHWAKIPRPPTAIEWGLWP